MAENWDRIFNQVGRGAVASMSGSNPEELGSKPSAPATYVDDATGRQVDEAWWPGDEP